MHCSTIRLDSNFITRPDGTQAGPSQDQDLGSRDQRQHENDAKYCHQKSMN